MQHSGRLLLGGATVVAVGALLLRRFRKRSKAGKAEGLITEAQWDEFHRQGYVNIGKVIPEELFAQMKRRISDIMLGKVQYGDKLMMQLDPGGGYDSKTTGTDQTASFKGATEKYRKIGEAGMGLECDPVFREVMGLQVFKEACARIYGAHADISVYRSMVFNKPPKQGTDLPWHQDGGGWWSLDRDPLLFVWTAIDPALKSNGCVRVVPGSHKYGLLSQRGHTLSAANLEKLRVAEGAVDVEVGAGESVLMHNFLVHSSGTNPSNVARKAFSVNYIDSRTRVCDPKVVVQPENFAAPLGTPGMSFPELWCGSNATTPY